MRVRSQRRGVRTYLKAAGAFLAMATFVMIPFLASQPAQAFAGGTGTQLDPFQISTPADLASLTSYLGSAHSGKYFELVNDIDLNVSSYNTGTGWTPIGGSSSSTAFYGKFDGNGHTISNLYSNRTSMYVGLFGNVYTGAIIQDVNMTNANVTSTAGRVGILAGMLQGATVTNSSTSGTVTSGGSYTGGLVGYSNLSTISGSHSSATVTSTSSNVGGLIGAIEGSSLSNSMTTTSYATGNVRGNSSVGGFVGYRYHGTISQSYATGDVLGDGAGGTTNTTSGGFVGTHCQGLIDRSFATGDVYGTDYIAGFAGYSHNCNGTISNSYARGNVYAAVGDGGSFMEYIYLGTVTNSYATGSVAGKTNGGFIFYDHTCSSCTNNFWDTQTSGQTTGGIFSGGRATGKTTAQMKDVATFTTTGTAGLTTPWDFVGNPNNDVGNNDYWNIDPAINDGYPYLAWYTPVNAAPTVSSLGPSSRTNGAWSNDGSISLTFVTGDDEDDLVSHRVQVDDSADFSSPIIDVTSTSQTPGAKTLPFNTPLDDGTYYWRVKATDSNGAESSYVTANGGAAAFRIDSIAPLSPDNPVRVTDANDNTPTLEIEGSIDAGGSGLANPAYVLEWSQDSGFNTGVQSATTNSTTYTIGTPLADGQWYTRATAFDNAGNSTMSDTGTFLIDTTAPVLQSVTPAHNSVGASLTPTLSMQFDQIVGLVSGDILIRKVSDGTIVETIPVGGGPVGGSGTNTITADPFYPLEYDTTYYIEVDSGAIDDLYRNFFVGISGDSDWRFTTTSAPVVAAEGTTIGGSTTGNTSSGGSTVTSTTTSSSTTSDQLAPIVLNDYPEYAQGSGKQVSLGNGQVVYFMHQNQQHSVTVSFVSADIVQITIASTPKVFQLRTGESAVHDVDGDGRDDIKATFVGMSGGVAEFAFQQIAVDDQPAASEDDSNGDSSAAPGFDWTPFLLAGAGIVLVVAIGIIAVRRRVKS